MKIAVAFLHEMWQRTEVRSKMKLHPWKDAVPAAIRLIEAGHNIYQQFNCAGCGVKQTMDVPNTFYQHGICEECGHDTDIQADGFNYMVHMVLR